MPPPAREVRDDEAMAGAPRAGVRGALAEPLDDEPLDELPFDPEPFRSAILDHLLLDYVTALAAGPHLGAVGEQLEADLDTPLAGLTHDRDI